ncbi:DNA internalization-related competence protein ComEC/Rec2 [Rubrivivax rivuli]|uniref:DNA internalization-related competence protein ComEC/Rec2 n=1 Tax=Rubrivivax rivuli TaxID=1862385 RepID=A0A437RK49_9BURK|nr:DNA internalization-related competence protein ComEC/Rec2 [Rubrivivax rivuli]RVU47161.1 DNA internalization-related competence protein ComEC/Rec2 [Rubrivivax rivuli]
MAREDWEVFRLTGVAHLMSISGLHVTMFAWLAGTVIGWLWRRSARAPLWLPAPQAARWGGLVCALAYALLAGWGVPAQRTVGMIAVVVLLRTVGARWPLHAVLLAVALAVAMGDPWALLQPGFWLSFVAVALLVASEPAQAAPEATAAGWRAAALQALRGGLRTQAVATVGLAPLTLVFFQQLSLVGFAANLVAIPLVTLLVVPLAMAGVLLPPLWSLAAAFVEGLMVLLHAMAAWPWALWQTAAAPLWALACGLLAGALAVLPLPPRWRWLALPLLLPLLWPPVPRPGPGQFELVAADVGQGTAVLVRTQRHLLVYDAGPAYTPEADAGSRVLLPLLRARGERHISLLMLSHRDTDHTGGAAALLDGLPVRALASSLENGHPLLANAAARQVPHSACNAGQRWVWDGVQFDVLHPPAEALAAERRGKPNTLSCVLRVQATAPGLGGGPPPSALLTGDIEAAQEAALVQQHGAALASRLLLVPHHGSKTSSTPAFLQAVRPAQAVVQAAYRSRYGHPAPAVMARYEALGVQPLRSDRCGAYVQAADGSGHCQRQMGRRYWHHGSAAPHPAPPAGRP